MTTLYIIDGHDRRQTVEFSGNALLLGRSPACDLQIKDPFVSRKHLKISSNGARIFIKDLDSRNGTFVNGEPIHPGVEIEVGKGVPVVMGMSVLCFGEGCVEQIQEFLGSIDISGLEPEEADSPAEDRPMTAQRNAELMFRVSDLLNRPADVRDTLKKVLKCVFDLLVRIDRAAIILLDHEEGRIKEVICQTREGIDDQRLSKAVLTHVVQLKEAFMISDADTEDEQAVPDTLKLLNIKSVMCVPLMNREKLVGVLYVDSLRKPYGFRGEDLHLLSAMGTPVAEAIEAAFAEPVGT